MIRLNLYASLKHFPAPLMTVEFCVPYWIGKIHEMYLKTFLAFLQNVKSYLRRGTAREMLGYYKEAMEGESISFACLLFFL